MKKKFIFVLLLFLFAGLIFAVSCKKPKVYSVAYVADSGGKVYGNTYQEIEEGKDGTEVVAVADSGYRFAGWSDGLETAERTEKAVTENKTVTAMFEKIVYFDVTYVAEAGGKVYGNTYQEIEEGKDGTEVVAVADSGYRFAGWSDGLETAERTEKAVTENKTVTAKFEQIAFYELTYKARTGGKIKGNAFQLVEEGKDGTAVEAIADNGYRFAGWSDGVLSAERKDSEVYSGKEQFAIFECINVLFYSDDYLVRNIPLISLNSLNLSALVGYKSNSVFIGWKFSGPYADVYSEYEGDALALLKYQFNLFGISGIRDIELSAVYEDADGSVPEKSKTIAHALGGKDGKSYLNSKEAFDYNYSLGQRFFEVDLMITTDFKVIASHGGEYSFDEYMGSASEEFTPLSLGDILDIMTEYEDIWLDFDVTGIASSFYDNYYCLFENIAEEVNKRDEDLYDRIILEINPAFTQMLDMAKQQTGLKNFLYALYGSWCDILSDSEAFEEQCEWCEENGIKFMSLPRCYKEYLNHTQPHGIYLMVYTVNDIVKMYEYYDMGVDCIFSDFVLI